MADTGIVLEWQGPFEFSSLAGRSIFSAEAGKGRGIYAWGVETPNGLLPHYVGETDTSFSRRHLEHFKAYADGTYSTRNGELFGNGKEDVVFPGRYWKKGVPINHHQPFIDGFAEMAKHIVTMLGTIRIYVAELSTDQRTRRRVEAGLVDGLYRAPEEARSLFAKGYRTWRRRVSEDVILVDCANPPPIVGFPLSFEA